MGLPLWKKGSVLVSPVVGSHLRNTSQAMHRWDEGQFSPGGVVKSTRDSRLVPRGTNNQPAEASTPTPNTATSS